jgi:hypothetical protein
MLVEILLYVGFLHIIGVGFLQHRVECSDHASAEDIAGKNRDPDRAQARRGSETPIDPVKLAAEISELEGYRALALKIGTNAKGGELVSALPKAMQQIVEKGAQRSQARAHPILTT